MDTWTLGLTLLAMGMLTCFVVLGVLSVIIRLLNLLFPYALPGARAVTAESLVVAASEMAVIVSTLEYMIEPSTGWQVTAVRRIGREKGPYCM